MPPLLRAQQLTRRLGGAIPVTLVENVSLEIQRGEFIAITGPSGSGKSSLLYLLGLLDRPTSGTVSLEDADDVFAGSDEHLADIRLASLGFVFQFHFLLPEFSALENVMLPMRRLGRLPTKDIVARAQKLLADLGLEAETHKRPAQLSGGQSQRVAIARALANDPHLILADEPTGNLDSASSSNLERILKQLAHEYNRAVVIVTHDTRLASSVDRVLKIVDGKLSD